MITVIDYGAGNLKSVEKALNFLGAENEITSDPEKIKNAEKLILPGVGSFGAAMENLKSSGIDAAIKKAVSAVPILGICLGLHLMFEYSEESNCGGLGILKGKVGKIPDFGLKIPHVGWNSLNVKGGKIFDGIQSGTYVYFVHSYCISECDEKIVTATVDYGCEIPIAVQSGNVHAVQFHPEKSGEDGLRILENFVKGV